MAIVVLALYGASFAVGLGPVGLDPRVTIGVGVLLLSLGAIAGKQLGIAHSRHKRAVLLRELKRRVAR